MKIDYASNMQIVVLEDDNDLRRHLSLVIKSQGWQSVELSSIDELETLLLGQGDFPLFILDRMIGKQDSVYWLQKIKAKYSQAKILILSSISTPDEKAKWLMAGADEYMGKPIFSEELIARIHLLLRRPQQESLMHLKIGDLIIDRTKHIVTKSGVRLDLTAKEYGLLQLLSENPGRVYNKTQILEHLWDMSSQAETNVVESTINHLRRKIEQSNSTISIKSKRNIGYWVEA